MKVIKKPELKDTQAIYTFCGGDWCPLCNIPTKEPDNILTKDLDEIPTNKGWLVADCSYCERCKVVFLRGCLISEHGCCGSLYEPCLIVNYTDKNEVKIEGMPIFDSFEEFVRMYYKVPFSFECLCGKCNSNQEYVPFRIINPEEWETENDDSS